MFPFLGIRLIESPLMVDQNHIGTQLNGYRASFNRSKRVWKKLIYGTKKRRPLVEPIIESVPKSAMYQLPSGDLVGHPSVIARVKQEMSEMGKQLGMRL